MDQTTNGAAELWRQRVAAQQASGQSIRGWCKQNDCHDHSFYWWRSRLGLSPVAAKRRRVRRRRRTAGGPGAVAFAEVVVDRRAAPVADGSGERLCLRLAGGRELLLPAATPARRVAELIRAIEVAS
jgi:hypothetical protein